MTGGAEINAQAWTRRRLLAVLAGGVAAALLMLTGLGFAVHYAIQQPADAATAGRAVDPSAPVGKARGEQHRDQVAAAPMLEVAPEDAREGTPSTTPGPSMTVPAPTTVGPVEVPTGFPKTPAGAVGQLSTIMTTVLQGMSIDHAHAVYEQWSLPGATEPSHWRMTKNVQAFLSSSGQQGQAKAPTTSVTARPLAGQIKGTDGPEWVLACVLVDVQAVVATQSRIAYGHCERMQWSADQDRWVIAPGPEPAPAPSTWPGTDRAHEAGWRTWIDDSEGN
ncbi:hypothetical protein IGS73_07425 [Janibacter indicus]|uniref:Uncharacterized protein n=1 Tax=Janibacter indicus TaxID=857417 RepID=A0A7L9J614_9MICO|nr:hypothetical protein [Janibacter indicus]QOK24180.1 hypothetical protein IGS73_07425 [Janibacter indicus]